MEKVDGTAVTREFETLNQAASALLVETCNLLNNERIGYVVAGGWVPEKQRIRITAIEQKKHEASLSKLYQRPLHSKDRQSIGRKIAFIEHIPSERPGEVAHKPAYPAVLFDLEHVKRFPSAQSELFPQAGRS